MKNTKLTYKEALKNISKLLEIKDTNLFDGSTALALVFNLSKEETFNDLVEYRKKELGIKVIPKKDR